LSKIGPKRRASPIPRNGDVGHKHLADILSSVAEHFIYVDKNLRIIFANARVSELFAHPLTDIVGRPAADWFPSFRDPQFLRHYAAALKKGRSAKFEIHSDLNGRWYECRVHPTPEGFGAFYLDITDRRLAEAARNADADRVNSLVGSMPVVTWQTDTELNITTAVGGGLRSLGMADNELVGQNLRAMFPDPRSPTIIAHERALGGEPSDYDDTFAERQYHAHVEPLRDAGGAVIGVSGLTLDVTERNAAETEIARLAVIDTVTGLPNRTSAVARLGQAVRKAAEGGRLVAVFCVDINDFKDINQSVGHAAGDVVLKSIGERLNAIVRRGDIVARIGSDEFAVMFVDVASESDIALLFDKVKSVFRAPFQILSREMHVGIRCGLALAPDDGTDPAELVARADSALRVATQQQSEEFVRFRSDMQSQLDDRLELQNMLYQAIRHRQFALHYQPIVDAGRRRLLGVEALIRWLHPERGLLSPAEFIPIAEQTGLIISIGGWILQTACEAARRWQSGRGPSPMMHVNLSAKQFADPTLVKAVAQTLRDTGLAPEHLCLEVTESSVVQDVQAGAAVLRSLRNLGVKTAIDDFGTGYSSLSYLRSFAFDTLKIDRSFVRLLPDSGEDAAIARGIIALGHALGMTVTAEGVETENQSRFLQASGCDSLQGYLIGRPSPEADLMVTTRKYLP
jgi:diguanylate cyclase (GGDEF)-like protein/PAS domain S-box-containing protein